MKVARHLRTCVRSRLRSNKIKSPTAVNKLSNVWYMCHYDESFVMLSGQHGLRKWDVTLDWGKFWWDEKLNRPTVNQLTSRTYGISFNVVWHHTCLTSAVQNDGGQFRFIDKYTTYVQVMHWLGLVDHEYVSVAGPQLHTPVFETECNRFCLLCDGYNTCFQCHYLRRASQWSDCWETEMFYMSTLTALTMVA